MALIKPSMTFGNGLSGSNLYCRIKKIEGDKNHLIATINIYLNKEVSDQDGFPLAQANAIFEYDLNSTENAIKQAYARFKAVDPIQPNDAIHFRDCTDA